MMRRSPRCTGRSRLAARRRRRRPSSPQVAGVDVARIGALPGSLPMPSLPAVSIDRLSELFGAAFAVAALAAIESLLSAKVADGMADTGRHDPDRELFGQGLANLASPLFGGMPATGAIARTAVNVRAGARTRVSPRSSTRWCSIARRAVRRVARRPRSRSPRWPAC